MHLSYIDKLATTLSLAALLAACGGGGGSSGGSSPTDTTTTTATATTVTTAAVTTTTGSTTSTTAGTARPQLPSGSALSGVVATGSPLLGATISVVDAAGAAVGSSTSLPDGSYRLVLPRAAPLPLLLEAQGQDAAGNPVVMHSMVATNALPVIAHLTPATEAVVAMIVGSNPLTVFQNAASNGSNIALLGTATTVSAASDLVKTVIAANLTDGKVANAKTLDFFQDPAFSANKNGLDAALEGLRIQVTKDANGKDQLQLSNKFLAAAGTVEVKVDLATAKSELAKLTGGSAAKAIVSTTAVTSSATASLVNLALLDNLTVALNSLIAQGGTPFVSASPLFAGYSVQYGVNKDTLVDTLNGYAAKNYQLGKFQVTGCTDDAIGSKTACSRTLVSASVTNSTGQIVGVLNDAVAYAKTPTPPTPNWTFTGNNAPYGFQVFPVAVATYGLNGVLATGSATNPNTGVQIALDSDATSAIRLITTPSGYSIAFAECGRTYQCVSISPLTALVASGELKDSLLDPSAIAWIGSKDGVSGAKYLVAPASGSGPTLFSYLKADVPASLGSAPFPRLDDNSALTPSAIVAGPNLSWANWAATYPNLKVFMARTIVSATTGKPLIQDATIPVVAITSVRMPPAVPPPGFVPVGYQVWLGAQDAQGRRYYSKFTSAP